MHSNIFVKKKKRRYLLGEQDGLLPVYPINPSATKYPSLPGVEGA
jgi:hypothetical protein